MWIRGTGCDTWINAAGILSMSNAKFGTEIIIFAWKKKLFPTYTIPIGSKLRVVL
jgi:hypothetical protein